MLGEQLAGAPQLSLLSARELIVQRLFRGKEV